MINVSGCSEIVESPEVTPRSKMNELIVKHRMLKPGQVCSVEDDINKLFEAMDNTILGTDLGLSNQVSKDSLRKRAMKRPMRSCSKIGFSDSVSLKEAFRGLSISHASKMAAVKRLSKQANSSRTSKSVSINKNLVDISLVPEESTSKFPENIKLFPNSNLRNRNTSLLPKADEISKFQDEVEFPQSSICRDEITLPGYRPHMSKDVRWEVIHCFLKRNGSLSLEHFKLIKKLGGGDIGAVYLAELTGTNCLFALKIMDNEFLISRNKSRRAETEIEILRMLDHPFLPSLFACFTTERFTVLVMQYCPRGDLHVLRKIEPKKRFSEKVSRFYVAEVVVALEYLHMLGIVYRDLKLENVLVREDGHIILSDFDLSLRCSVSPTLVETSPTPNPPKTETNHNSETKSTHPLCCFQSTKSRKQKADLAALVSPLCTNARSNSFVGTHEYLSPEIITGEDHGSAVDWWTLGIFLYELIYGKTPFKGSTNEDTLSNIVSNTIEFPDSPVVSPHTRGLIVGLLEKEPKSRLGSVRGANEIKQHPFFKGINWALIRCIEPPKLSSGHRLNADVSAQNDKGTKCKDRFTGTVENMAFEMF